MAAEGWCNQGRPKPTAAKRGDTLPGALDAAILRTSLRILVVHRQFGRNFCSRRSSRPPETRIRVFTQSLYFGTDLWSKLCFGWRGSAAAVTNRAVGGAGGVGGLGAAPAVAGSWFAESFP